MKLNCGPTWNEKVRAKEQWHEWFAWHPVRVAPGRCRWLERVRRKGRFRTYYGGSHWDWLYEPIDT